MNRISERLSDALAERARRLPSKTVFLGFDAFVDLVVRPVRSGDARRVGRYYDRMEDFARFIAGSAGHSGSVELAERAEKLGGNAPILGNALAALGCHVRIVAPFGLPSVHPCFAELARIGDLYSTGDPGLSLALEFQDGKLMLAINRQMNHLDYGALTTALPPERLLRIVAGCDALAFVNWSELPGSTDLLDGMARDVLPALSRPTPLLVDLSDCSRREPGELRDYLERLSRLPAAIRTILSLNRKEAAWVCRVLEVDPEAPDAQRAADVRKRLDLEWVVLHHRDASAIAWDGGEDSLSNRIRNRPALLTGAGDNFNAGLLAGRLMELPPEDCLALASLVSGSYVEHGTSPGIADLAFVRRRTLKEERP